MRGLNRHQSYPYMGYAAPESLQREDARILKEELCCNAVRTSHYPQSQYFIDECDRLGLLVFTELPGWRHIGDERWKEQACENLREMILQYRNHPSIVLWGVRINEAWTTTRSTRARMLLPMSLTPRGLLRAYAIFRKATCLRTCIRITTSPTPAITPA